MALTTISSNGDTLPLRALPLRYDKADSEQSARALVIALNPEWAQTPGSIEFVRFKDGITNTLFKAVKKRPGFDDHQIDAEAVLLRAYGNGTDVLIDRDREAHSHALLARHNLAPTLLARFENGLLYKFIEGSACAPDDLQREDVWPAIAGLLGRWHAILPTAETTDTSEDNTDPQYALVKKLIPDKPLPHLWSVMQKWINALPCKTAEEKTRNSTLQAALEETATTMANVPGLSNGAYVMSHCDLLSGNVIMLPSKIQTLLSKDREVCEVAFIDYEYTTPTPAAFDLANHFAEYIGFDCDMKKIPSRSSRRAFLREYVAEFRRAQSQTQTDLCLENGAAAVDNHKTNGADGQSAIPLSPPLEDDVDCLMSEVDEFRGLPGLYWGIWALIQATISCIDFDYASYADIRLSEYWDWKAEKEGSRKRDHKELSTRENKWAQEE